MSHQRRTYIDRVLALVSNLPTTESRVEEWSGYALAEEWPSWVVVQSTGDARDDEADDQESIGVTQTIEILCGATRPDVRDQISLEVREAIACSGEWMTWTGSTTPPPEIGASAVFVATESFTVRWSHPEESPAA